MHAEQRVLVTRPAGQSERLIAGLRELGCDVSHLPMLRLVPCDPLPGSEKQRLLDLDLYSDLLFISSNAAHFGLALIDDYWPQFPVGQRYWAVGESTARVLEARGLDVSWPDHDMTTEGLLALPGLQQAGDRKMLIVKGEGGREALREALEARGARVDTLSCYRREAPELAPEAVQEKLMDTPVSLILISSGEGLDNLSRLLQLQENTNLADTALIVPSERVARRAEELGWRQVSRAGNASDDAMLAAVREWADASERAVK